MSVDRWNQTKRLALAESTSVSWGEHPFNWSVLANLLILRRTPVSEDKPTKVLIIRIGRAELYAFIGPFHERRDDDNPRETYLRYLVFPYVEE